MRFPPGVQTHRLQFEARPSCLRCRRPEQHCLCDAVQPFRAHCDVLILQHPHERKKYYGTAKLVARFIENSSLLRAVELTEGELGDFLGKRKVSLLFPSADASPADAVPFGADHGVLLLDGTWSEARKLLRVNPLLQQLPKVSFRGQRVSQYHIRKQPKEGYLSTIECVGHFLTENAAVSGAELLKVQYQRLFAAFDQMVAKQLAFFPRMRPKEQPLRVE